MRISFMIIFALLIIGLIVCAHFARRSKKSIGVYVSFLLYSLIPPVIGNMIIVGSTDETISIIGYYFYFLGMDLIMFALIHFTLQYCSIGSGHKKLHYFAYGLMILDVLQYILNAFLGQAFTTEEILVEDSPYFKMIPYWGQTYHRIVDYGIFFAILIVFLRKWIKAPRIYAERYYVIFFSMVIGGFWETAYIFSGSPIDRSMIGFAVFGYLVFYFSIYYRPMRLLDRMLANIASEMPEALFFFDANGLCIWANEPGVKLANLSDGTFEQAATNLRRIFGQIEREEDDWRTRHVSGEGRKARYFMLERHAIRNAAGRLEGSFLNIRDCTIEQLELRKERYNATHDILTDLYTREYLYEMIRKHLDEDPDEEYVIAYLDVKDFKLINDIFGNEFGDHALRCIADRIRSESSEATVYGRLVGDTFGLCIPEYRFAPERFEKILSYFMVEKDGVQFQLIIHMGAYRVNERNLDVSVMFDRARMAQATIKDDVHKFVAYYDDNMRQSVLWERYVTEELAAALEQRQIRPYLQPIVGNDGRLLGAEALVRWVHPVEGIISPGRFIPVFEKNGMIAEVDKYMWRCACEILARWKEEGRNLFLSVNISPKDFYFMDVVEELTELVREYGVETERLRLEITETVMMTEAEKRIELLNNLREKGFIVEMDDFGSGYSSMNMLKDMPVDVLKIDMVFLEQTENNEKALTILRNIISLADALGMVSLTEGVETEEQYRILRDMGCCLFQGYYFAKPLPVEEFETYIKAEQN